MIRNGATDNVLSYLSSSEVLRLQNVSTGNWEGSNSLRTSINALLKQSATGYSAPQSLQQYSIYLDSRIRAYRDLKHDAIRVQSETNRDARVLRDIEEDGYKSGKNSGNDSLKSTTSGHQRSKTLMGRKLRVMTVEKGLLRETKVVQRMIDALTECRVCPLYFRVAIHSLFCLCHSCIWTTWKTSLQSVLCECWSRIFLFCSKLETKGLSMC